MADFNGIAEVLEDGDQLEFAVKRKGTKKEMLIAFGKVPADQTGEVLEGTVETDNAECSAWQNAGASSESNQHSAQQQLYAQSPKRSLHSESKLSEF